MQAATLEDGGAFGDSDRVGCVVCGKEIWDAEGDWGDPYHPLHPCEHAVLYWTTNSDSPAFCESSLLAKARTAFGSEADSDGDGEEYPDSDDDETQWVFEHGHEIAELAAEHFGKAVTRYAFVGHDDSFLLVVGTKLHRLDAES